MTEFISKERIFANATKLTEILLNSESYANFHERLSVSDLDYNENKTYEVAPSGFIDFNQHLYEDINHMNSISTGLYLEKSFITFNIFIWTSRGEGFAIFKHILRGEEINKLNNIVNVVNDLLKDKIKLFEFKENNNRTFASFELKEPLNTKESIFLKGKINKEVYHLEIDNGNNTKSTIEIHLKNPLEKDLALERNNKNNV